MPLYRVIWTVEIEAATPDAAACAAREMQLNRQAPLTEFEVEERGLRTLRYVKNTVIKPTVVPIRKRNIPFDVACREYQSRYTLEHIPSWVNKQINGTHLYYAPQYATDREWYDNTVFPGEEGLVADAGYSESRTATWPLGRALSKPITDHTAAELKALALKHGTGIDTTAQ